jgi:hypothetical protein
MVKKNSVRLPLTSKPGMKVKVYENKKNVPARFGETLGILESGLLLLSENKALGDLPLHHFNYILHVSDVKFINDAEATEEGPAD